MDNRDPNYQPDSKIASLNTYNYPQQSVVYVQQPQIVSRSRWFHTPPYLQNGVQIACFHLWFYQIVVSASFGLIIILLGIQLIGVDYVRQLAGIRTAFGSSMIVIGLLMIVSAIAICFYAKKKYKQQKETGHVNNPTPGNHTLQYSVSSEQPPSRFPPCEIKPGSKL